MAYKQTRDGHTMKIETVGAHDDFVLSLIFAVDAVRSFDSGGLFLIGGYDTPPVDIGSRQWLRPGKMKLRPAI